MVVIIEYQIKIVDDEKIKALFNKTLEEGSSISQNYQE